MLTGLIIIGTVLLLGVLSHRKTRLQTRVLKNVPLYDWYLFVILPVVTYIGWYIIIRNIIHRPVISLLPFDDLDIILITVLFFIYGFAGNGVHFVSKIISRHLKADKRSVVYRVNEMFHGKFSHYLTFLTAFFIVFMLSILEINHPLNFPMENNYMILIIIAGIIVGLTSRKAVFFTNEWFGGFNKPIIFVVSGLILLLTALFKGLNLNIILYPIGLFVSSAFISFIITFIIRQIFIFTRLDEKRRMRFINKIFSI
jgi:hypothetical protein